MKHSRTSVNRRHSLGVITSIALIVAGFALIGFGIYAWLQPRPELLRLATNTQGQLSTTPLFEPGVTIFVQGEDYEPGDPRRWRCRLTRGAVETRLTVRADYDEVGSRVVEGEPYSPIVNIGPTKKGDTVSCNPQIGLTKDLVVLPTAVGVRPLPLAFVVGGIGCFGLSGLVHPRGRGIHKFGS